MRLPRTPEKLRHIPAAVAFWSIAISTVDPRLGSPLLAVAAAAVGIGLILKRPFAKPLGAGLASGWILMIAFPGQSFPAWNSVAWATAGLAGLALATLAFTPTARRYSTRGALACASVGLVAGLIEWHAFDELWPLFDHALALGVLAGAGLLALRRPREAGSLVVALGAFYVMQWALPIDRWMSVVSVAAGWWIAEHALRAIEERPFANGRLPRYGSWVAAASLFAFVGLIGFDWITAEYASTAFFDVAFFVSFLGLMSFLGLSLLRGAQWAGPLVAGVGVVALLFGQWLAEPEVGLLGLAGVLVAPTAARLDARRGLALGGLGAALAAGLLYAFFRNAHGDPGNAVLAFAGLGAAFVATVGFARGRTWGVLATLAAIGLFYLSSQAVSGVSALDRMGGCVVLRPFPLAITLGGLYVSLAAYALPFLRAVRGLSSRADVTDVS